MSGKWEDGGWVLQRLREDHGSPLLSRKVNSLESQTVQLHAVAMNLKASSETETSRKVQARIY